MREKMERLTVLALRIMCAVTAPRIRDERGDVPGWVLVTVMTAGLVGALWKLAGPQLNSMVTSALNSVHG
jgi:hypothetical protein